MARKRQHLDRYELSEDGSYTYRGSFWRWDPPEQREPFVRALTVLLSVTGIALFGAGMVPLGRSGSFLMTLPYALGCIFAVLSASCAVRISREGDPMRDYVYESSVERLKPRLALGSACCFASAVGSILTTLIWSGSPSVTFPFCAFMLAAGLAMGQSIHRMTGITFTKED